MFEYFSGDGGRKKRQIVKERQYHNKWSEGVYYIFNETAKKPDYGYLAVTDEYEYMSHVGRLGEEQPLSIGESCETEFGRAIHEVGHALGLYHFHSRYDRDRYITVRPNSMPHKDHEVEYAMVLRNESRNYGTSYDYGSVMHYGVNSENPVMIPANRYHNRTMGSAIISLVDYWLINKHYGCLENCAPEKSEKCANGGFAHPRNCDVCVCPTGYGGPYCNERSPPGTVIEIKIEEEGIPGGFEEPGCTKAAVEIKTNKNQTLTGYRCVCKSTC
ncbi:astacin [Ancylostoma ceylanicum]|uniref:Metalloendopeptidase n=1 Tax=Ancylostoma ceylanicum TaxID=53326 RepID=A0A0D6LPF8_9BILA|nr:astacin [Ancylostoma ceylanicum]